MTILLGSFLFGMCILCFPSQAEENIEELKEQIEALQQRVEELEATQQNSQQGQEQDDWGFFNSRGSGGWDPFSEMDRIQQEMNRMFQNSYHRRGSFSPGMFSNAMSFDYDLEVEEIDDGYQLKVDMTGLDEEKIDIQINEHSITVTGEHSKQEDTQNPHSRFSSRSFGSFTRTIPLPVDADTAAVKTEKEGDYLVIRLPKKES